ncbi:MAG: methyl-accepting chemotaxis protein [Treponema sp.]|nr:methyl-accepting chemotaxis protein [Treponema sp.]
MDEKTRKFSLAAKITIVCLSITFLTVLMLSIVFITNARNIIQEQAATSTQESVHALRDRLLARFGEWDALMKFTAANAASIIAQEPFDPQAIHTMLRRNAAIQPVALALFTTSNIPWWYEDGWAISHNQSLQWTPQPDWHNWERPWFLAAKANPGRVGYAQPFFSALWPGVLIIALGTNIYDEAGNDIGVIAADIEIGFLQSMVDEIITLPGHGVHLINRQGLFITHPDPDAVMTRDFFDEAGLGRYRNDVLGRSNFSSLDGDFFVYSELIPGIDWILVSTIPTAAIFAEMNQFVLHMVLVGLGLLIVAALVSLLFTYKGLTVPIRSIKSAADALAGMNFSVDIKKTESNEIGDMQIALITIRDNLKKGIDEIQNSHLSKTSERSRRLNNVVVDSFTVMEDMARNISSMDGNVGSQMDSVQTAATSVEEIVSRIDSFQKTVFDQAAYVSQSSKAIEVLITNIAGIRTTVEDSEKILDTFEKSSETGKKMLEKLFEGLKSIERQSETLQAANKTISDIAGQTNILAMNAAIEAARAGESGKGFAVVASEIRKLAELSSRQSESISVEIKNMEKSIDQIGKVSQETINAMDTIFTGANTVNSSFDTINHSIRMQASESVQILDVLRNVQSMTDQVKTDTEILHRQSGAIHREVGKLQNASQKVNEGVGNVRTASKELSSFLENAKSLGMSSD